jgi:hypothetical protein
MPYMCEHCGEIFPRQREVIYHEWRHTGTPKGTIKPACGAKEEDERKQSTPEERGCVVVPSSG